MRELIPITQARAAVPSLEPASHTNEVMNLTSNIVQVSFGEAHDICKDGLLLATDFALAIDQIDREAQVALEHRSLGQFAELLTWEAYRDTRDRRFAEQMRELLPYQTSGDALWEARKQDIPRSQVALAVTSARFELNTVVEGAVKVNGFGAKSIKALKSILDAYDYTRERQ